MDIKKIAFISVFYPFRGGIALFSDKVLLALQKKRRTAGVNFKRQYPNFLFPGKTQYVADNVLATKSENVRIVDSINPLSYLKTARFINRQQPEVLITRYWMSFFAPALGMITRLVKKKTVKIALLDNVIPHEKRFYDDFCNRYYLNAQDGFVVMSEQVANDLQKYVPNAKYILLEHPKYNQFGEKKDRQQACNQLAVEVSKKTILFFGLIRDYKGLDLLIKAFGTLDDSFQLIIAGECYGSFEKYQSLIDSNANKERIKVFNQFIPDDEIALYFSIADVCVLPYRSATQSGIHAISDHFEVPTIVTQVGGLPEYIEEGKTGVLALQPTEEAIGHSILTFFELLNNVDFAANIRAKDKSLTWDEFADQMVKFASTIKK